MKLELKNLWHPRSITGLPGKQADPWLHRKAARKVHWDPGHWLLWWKHHRGVEWLKGPLSGYLLVTHVGGHCIECAALFVRCEE